MIRFGAKDLRHMQPSTLLAPVYLLVCAVSRLYFSEQVTRLCDSWCFRKRRLHPFHHHCGTTAAAVVIEGSIP